MMTEIEWWGGMLFIWLAFTNTSMYKVYGRELMFDLGFVLYVLASICVSVVLVLYFYTLETQAIQLLYMGSIVLGLCLTVIWYFLPESKAVSSRLKEIEALEDDGEDEQETGKGFEVFSDLLFIFPMIVAIGLGIYKSRDYLDNLPF